MAVAESSFLFLYLPPLLRSRDWSAERACAACSAFEVIGVAGFVIFVVVVVWVLDFGTCVDEFGFASAFTFS